MNISKFFADKKVVNTVKLFGDASYRAYYRITLGDGSTLIVMQMPEGRSSASEEITNFAGKPDEPPFINIARFLDAHKVRVPKIIFHDSELKQIILEDLGDDIMFSHATTPDALAIYKKAIDVMATMHATRDDGTCIAFKRSFDETLLNWEFDHFREYLVEVRGGKKIDTKELADFERLTRTISKTIVKMPQTFTHRDFQSRNIMITKTGELAVIDFQDALLGPYIYDLVSLLRDSYVSLLPKDIDAMLEHFKTANRLTTDAAIIEEHFHIVTLQRKMKDSGRFVYIDKVKGNPNYLKFIPTSLGYVKNALERLQIISGDKVYSELFSMIQKWVPKWQ